jgi:type IV pilus assembly protein PilO
MKLTSMQKMLAVIAAIALIVVVAVVLLVVPKFGELATLDGDLQAAKDEVAQTQALLAQLEQAKSDAALTQAELLQLANQMPENPELPSLLIELQDVSNAAGLRFNSVTPGEPVAAVSGQFTGIPVNVEVEGRWADVLDYMRRLNRLTRAIRVMSAELSPIIESDSPTEAIEPDVRGTMSMQAYVMGANGVLPGASAVPAGTAAQP